jgi:hypothetical protein
MARLSRPASMGDKPKRNSDRPLKWNCLGGWRVGSETPPLNKMNKPARASAEPNKMTASLERLDMSDVGLLPEA